MGNQESKPASQHSGAGARESHASSHGSHGHERRGTYPRRRESLAPTSSTLPSGTKAVATPSHAASLASATATPNSSSSSRSAEDSLKRAAQPPSTHQPSKHYHSHSSVASAPDLRPLEGASAEAMGNSASKDAAKVHADKARLADPAARPSPLPPQPIDVPPTHARAPSTATTTSEPFSPGAVDSSAMAMADYQPASPSQFSRPPRLPLPIEQEVHAPGSPILSPAEKSEMIQPMDDIQLSRRASVLSGTTAEDDDMGDDIGSLEPWAGASTVPALLEWREDGERVYVTGTFTGWDKKFRLHKKWVCSYML